MRTLINSKNNLDVVRRNRPQQFSHDLYHYLIILSWPKLLLIFVCGFFFSNFVFALLYFSATTNLMDLTWQQLLNSFFYSVESAPLIGTAHATADSNLISMIRSVETVVDLLALALLTGLIVAKFTLPSSRVMFSNNILITDFEGIPTLMMRAVNLRTNHIVTAQAKLTLLKTETTKEGLSIKRFHDLPLHKAEAPFLALSWTIMHPITKDSPLHGMNQESLNDSNCEFVITITGLDSTISRTIYSLCVYTCNDLHWGGRFKDVLTNNADGKREMNYAYFHEIID